MVDLLLSQFSFRDFGVFVFLLFFCCFSFFVFFHIICYLFSCFLYYLEAKSLEKEMKKRNKNNKPTV